MWCVKLGNKDCNKELQTPDALGDARLFMTTGVSMGTILAKKVITRYASLAGWGATHKVRTVNAVGKPVMYAILMGDSKVLLKPNPASVPKELLAFHLPPFSTQDHERPNALCLVRALGTYIDKTAGFRKLEQLFV